MTKKIATQILNRQQLAKRFVKLAVGSFNSMPGKVPGWSEPTPAVLSSPKPAAPQTFRGQGELGAPKFTPHLADKLKTQPQLDLEQGVANGPRQSWLSSVSTAGQGAAGYLGGAAKNIPLTAGRGIGYLTDATGLTNNWYRDFTESSIIAQDMRDRGWHQMVNPRSSQAYNDQYGTSGNVAQQMLQNKDPNYNNYSARAGLTENVIGPAIGWVGGPVAATTAATTVGAPAAVVGTVGAATGLAPGVADTVLGATGNNPPNQLQLQEALKDPANLSEITPGSGEFQLNVHGIGNVPLSSLSSDSVNAVLQQYPELEQKMLAGSGQYPTSAMTPSERVNFVGMPTDKPTPDGTEQAAQQAATQPQQPQQPQQQQPAAATQTPATPPKLTAEQQATVEKSLADAAAPNASPELKAKAEADLKGFIEAQAAANPAMAAGAKAFLAGDYQNKDAVAFRQHLDQVGNDVMDAKLKELYGDTPNPTPEQAGSMYAQAQDFWTSLPTESKVMLGLGLPLGILGIGSMLFGGGMMGMLAGALGLGAAGLVGANAGMFGDEARKLVGQAGLGVMDALGVKTPDVAPLSGLTEEEVTKRVQAALESGGAEAAQAELDKIRGQVGVIRNYNPDIAVTGMLARGAVPNSEAGYQLLNRGNKFLDDTADPNFIYNRAMQQGREQFGDVVRQQHPWLSWFAKPDYDNRANDWLYGTPEQRDARIAEELQKRYNLQKRSAVAVLHKAAMRWAN